MSETQLAVGPSHVSWEVRLNFRRNQLLLSGRGAFQVKENPEGGPWEMEVACLERGVVKPFWS